MFFVQLRIAGLTTLATGWIVSKRHWLVLFFGTQTRSLARITHQLACHQEVGRQLKGGKSSAVIRVIATRQVVPPASPPCTMVV
jgi:hypothetical protein